MALQTAHAQGINTGNISGTAADQTGAIIPGAMVTATNTATNVRASATADKGGKFSFKNLPIGTYTVVISNSGFSSLTLNNIQVSSAKEQGLGVEKLNPGSAQAVVEVSAAANILENLMTRTLQTYFFPTYLVHTPTTHWMILLAAVAVMMHVALPSQRAARISP